MVSAYNFMITREVTRGNRKMCLILSRIFETFTEDINDGVPFSVILALQQRWMEHLEAGRASWDDLTLFFEARSKLMFSRLLSPPAARGQSVPLKGKRTKFGEDSKIKQRCPASKAYEPCKAFNSKAGCSVPTTESVPGFEHVKSHNMPGGSKVSHICTFCFLNKGRAWDHDYANCTVKNK
jgi:hypothetical protein